MRLERGSLFGGMTDETRWFVDDELIGIFLNNLQQRIGVRFHGECPAGESRSGCRPGGAGPGVCFWTMRTGHKSDQSACVLVGFGYDGWL